MNPLLDKLNRLQWIGLGLGGVFYSVTIAGLLLNPKVAYVSYLSAFIFWFGLSIGCLNVAMIHHLTGGAWGKVTRRFHEAGYMNLPVLAILFIPILFGLHELYPWANSAAVAADKVLKQKSVYENVPLFILRAIIFFAIWIQMGFLLRKWSLQQDFSADISPVVKARTLSGPGVVIVPFTVTFAFVDWIMSIEVAWYSTIFGIILLAGGVLIALALGVILLAWFQHESPLAANFSRKQFLDLGNMMLTFVMFWAYVAFSQLLITYSGDQPHGVSWYLHRIAGRWKWLLGSIALFQFLAPFLFLLFRSHKQNINMLAGLAAVIFFVNALQNFWAVAPTFYPEGLEIHWTDFTAWLGIGGIWMGVFALTLKKHPLVVRTVMETQPIVREASHEK